MRVRKITRSILIIIALFINIILWQNCVPAFQSTGAGAIDSLGSGPGGGGDGVDPDPGPIDLSGGFPRFQKIIQDNCVQCHGGANSTHPEIVDYSNLTTLSNWANHPKKLLIGGEPTKSLLYRRLRNSKGINDPAIQTMPKNARPLSDSDISFIEKFIKGLPKVDNICKDHNPKPSHVSLRRLSKTELINSIKTILDINYNFTTLPDIGGGPFRNSGFGQVTDQNYFDSYYEGISDITNTFINQNKNQNCFNQSGTQQNTCLTNQLNSIAELAYRKQLDQADKATYLDVVNKLNNNSEFNYTAKDKLEAGLLAILASPKFLYLIREGNGSGLKRYNDFEIATRVNLALFKSTPDRDLWNLAKNGKFSNTTEYKKIIADLLRNNSSHKSYSENLLTGWLDINKVKELKFNESIFNINQTNLDLILTDMRNESVEILTDIVSSKKSVNSIITGNTRFLNERLSKHYNINSNIRGNNLQKYDLPNNSPYADIGLFASTLLVKGSHPDRGSLIMRGLDVHLNFNCGTMGSAPENTPEIEEDDLGPNATEREIALAHTKSAACAGCHRAMDPYGIALGNFDALGRYKTKDRFGNNIDSKTEINNFSIADHKDMARAIAYDNKFKSCFAGVNINYFTTANMDLTNSHSDYCESRKISENLTGNNDNIQSLITSIFNSDYFLKWNDSN